MSKKWIFNGITVERERLSSIESLVCLGETRDNTPFMFLTAQSDAASHDVPARTTCTRTRPCRTYQALVQQSMATVDGLLPRVHSKTTWTRAMKPRRAKSGGSCSGGSMDLQGLWGLEEKWEC